jgi:hypothetical protein
MTVKVSSMRADEIRRTATISSDGAYRYLLGRRWANGPTATFVMLNPSTADAFGDDPTIRRCMGFAGSWGCGALRVLNLYALRATRPAHLWEHPDPVGPQNDEYLSVVLSSAQGVGNGPLIAAWGAHARDQRVKEVLAMAGADRFECLGLTKAGHPRHPLYLRGDAARMTL